MMTADIPVEETSRSSSSCSSNVNEQCPVAPSCSPVIGVSSNQDILNSPEANEVRRVISLADESNRMLKSTMGVFGQSVYTAESWFGNSVESMEE